MRYKDLITFYADANDNTEPIYDYETGEFIRPETKEFERNCFIMDLTREQKSMIYGDANKRALRISHIGKELTNCTKVKIQDKIYSIESTQQLRNKAVYDVLELEL